MGEIYLWLLEYLAITLKELCLEAELKKVLNENIAQDLLSLQDDLKYYAKKVKF